jgi:hypothetical protein
MDLLTPEQASPIVGVPAVQLRRWAYLRQGPPNRGTKHKPMYDEAQLVWWYNERAKLHSISDPRWINANGTR